MPARSPTAPVQGVGFTPTAIVAGLVQCAVRTSTKAGSGPEAQKRSPYKALIRPLNGPYKDLKRLIRPFKGTIRDYFKAFLKAILGNF